MNQKTRESLSSLGLLLLRAGAGALLLYGHGWGKLVHFSERATRFPDPLHIGAPASLALVVFAEVFCSLAVILGFLTRLATILLIIFFAVAIFVYEPHAPFQDKELALVYAVPFLTLLLTGGGRFALGTWLGKKLGGGKG